VLLQRPCDPLCCQAPTSGTTLYCGAGLPHRSMTATLRDVADITRSVPGSGARIERTQMACKPSSCRFDAPGAPKLMLCCHAPERSLRDETLVAAAGAAL
jgi:hypothetical protein